VDRKYALVPASAVARAKSGTPNVTNVLSVDDGPVGAPDANLRLYILLKEQNQRAGHFYDWRQHSRQPSAVVGATSIAIEQPARRLWAERHRPTVK